MVYIEGWGFYIEYFLFEFGFYFDLYFNFGCLVMELWCVCCLVVDIGFYYYQWMCQQVVDYLMENMLNLEGDVINVIDCYIVFVGQVIVYKIGMLEIFCL